MKLSHSLDDAVATVNRGGILAYPTEAVFGLGCNPYSPMAVQRLLSIKQRPAHKGLILLAANMNQLSDFIQPLADEVLNRVLATWPGPVTWLLPVNHQVSPLVRGNHDTIAVRVSAHPVCRQLCEKLGHPLISTSANLTGQPAAVSAAQVAEQPNLQIDLILNRPTGGHQRPSEIRDAISNTVIRPG